MRNWFLPTHFYRHLERPLDLSFVRDLVRQAYADIRRPSIDPNVFFKAQLVMFFEGLRFERKLIETASLNLSLYFGSVFGRSTFVRPSMCSCSH